jgi:hypothetical protein
MIRHIGKVEALNKEKMLIRYLDNVLNLKVLKHLGF